MSLTSEARTEGQHVREEGLVDGDQRKSNGQDGDGQEKFHSQDGDEPDGWTSYLSGWRLQILTFAYV